jgi:nicotinamide mononucleotide adenylyltransferase
MTNITKKPSYEQGAVNGRFQPPHLDHLKYITTAKEHCEFLWIGITRYDIRESISCIVDPHRSEIMANPLTYYERISIISEMLREAGIDRKSFGFIPFPIDTPDRLPDFLPTSVPCFTTICDGWNRFKIQELRRVGYNVIVLWEEPNSKIRGQLIRESIYKGDNEWMSMVPSATQRAIERLDLRNRLIEAHRS